MGLLPFNSAILQFQSNGDTDEETLVGSVGCDDNYIGSAILFSHRQEPSTRKIASSLDGVFQDSDLSVFVSVLAVG
jgi:hypothetical protein